MGRLFWKFFIFIWLAQLTTILGVTTFFWWQERQGRAVSAACPAGGAGAQAADHLPAQPQGHHPPPPVEPLVGGVLASLVFAALLARYFSRPIRTLRTAFDTAAAGDLDVRVGLALADRRDELADLARDFDRMAAQLQILVNGQRRLLQDFSRELRQPLAKLRDAVGLVRQEPKNIDSSIERIDRESRRLDRLVGELITLDRLESGTFGRRVEEVEVTELLAKLVGTIGAEAEARGVKVEILGDGNGIIDGDGELLHRAIENVVRHAIRHSPPGAAVTLVSRVDPDSGELWLAVRDAGPGVMESELQAIFTPFHRGSQRKDADDHGLGLAIAKRIVEARGGRIGGANRAEGGFCVEVTLPVRLPGW